MPLRSLSIEKPQSVEMSMRSEEDLISDGPENYEVLEKIASGSVSSVFKVRSKRGRLKNRLVAMKKTEASHSVAAALPSLYQSLCHPSIVSLFSMFATSSHRFQILELCSGGSLATFIAAHAGEVLHEEEARLILKPLVDALSYLKRESIVHRNINPENILLTEEFRIKVSNFDLATRLPSQEFVATPPSHCIGYVSPEILSRRHYDCSADLWSLGCIAFTCLVGKPPFQGSSIDDVFENILSARYTFPKSLSPAAASFIKNLIQIDPSHRQDLVSMLCDPFLVPPRPDSPVQLTSYLPKDDQGFPLKVTETINTIKASKPRPLPFRVPSSVKGTRLLAQKNPSRTPFQELQNVDLRRILSDEISLNERRATSDPLPKPAAIVGACASVEGRSNLAWMDSNSDAPRHSSLNFHPLLSSQRTRLEPRTVTENENENPLLNVQVPDHTSADDSEGDSESNITENYLPIGTARPTPFTTLLLSSRTHKTVNGQVTVLPSRSLLVDFREGERRKGNQGTEVFVVAPDGTEVSIYDAPHLSSPCCLTEPIVTYKLTALPRKYWKQYNDAGLLVTRLKQRTPKMVLHEPNVKYTLMANTPEADIELIFSDHDTSDRSSKYRSFKTLSPVDKSKDDHKPKMRLRFSRQVGTLEIAEYIAGPRGEEWTKKVLHVPKLDSVGDKLHNFTPREQEGFSRLLRFLRACEAAENIEDVTSAAKTLHVEEHTVRLPETPPSSEENLASYPTNRIVSGSRTIGRSFSIDLAPRPRMFSSTSKEQQLDSRTEKNVWLLSKQIGPFAEEHTSNLEGSRFTYSSSCFRDNLDTIEISSKQALQTRFIPSVGWCIRHNSKVSQGGRYKVMFLDGDVLDIDVDEEWVEFTDQSGQRQRRSIRECHHQRTLSERMKVFDEFVSIFEADALNQSV